MDKEDGAYNLPNDIAEELLCSNCSLYISCGPVKMGPDGSSLCGRCSVLGYAEMYISNILFEKSMNKFRFPCAYKAQGCDKQLLFGKSLEHESACLYRTLPCLSLPFNNCIEPVNGLNIYKHFEQDHKDLIITDGQLKLDLEKDSQLNLIMKYNGTVIVIQYNYTPIKKKLVLNVAYFTKHIEQALSYKLQFINGLESDLTVNCREHPCGLYDYFPLTEQNLSTIVFSMADYLPAINNPSFIIIKLTMINHSNGAVSKDLSDSTNQTNSEILLQQTPVVSWDVLEKYRCSVCYAISNPPVYTYVSQGYWPKTICFDCNQQLKHKSTEISIIEVNFPCHWRGCTFVGNENNIREHIEKCQFQTCICPNYLCDTGYYLKRNEMRHMKGHAVYCEDSDKIIINFTNIVQSEYGKYFTIWENKVILIYIAVTGYNSRIFKVICSDTLFKCKVTVYFEHDHCLQRSKTFPFEINSEISLELLEREFPVCFKSCKQTRAIFKITH